MSKKSVFCVAASEFQAVCIVDRLKDEGFFNADTSLLFVDKTDTRDFSYCSGGTKTPTGITGAMLSGAIGWLPDVSSLVFPEVGPVVAAGPISSALRSAPLGGISPALVGMGIPACEAVRYEAKIKQGGILIAARVTAAADAQLAEKIFKEEDALEIASSSDMFAARRVRTSSPSIQETLAHVNVTMQPALSCARESIQ